MFWQTLQSIRPTLRAYVVATLLAACFQAASLPAHASLTVLVGEPFGSFGTMMPVGHTAIYLDRVCADGPLKLRMCLPGEPQGVAIARYHSLGQTDWIAVPILPFLYATDRPEDIPAYVRPATAWQMRERLRTRFLQPIVPDGTENDKNVDEWPETVGTAFDRRLWGYQLDTTPQQDEALVARMNADENRHRYRLRGVNCADFAAQIVNAYFPGAVRKDRLADFGIMSPKQVARCVSAYGHAHPEAGFRIFEVPQVPGSLRRSRPVRGGAESFLKTKRYLATLLVIQPEIPLISAILYLDHGRWQIGRNAERVDPAAFASTTGEGSAASQTASQTASDSVDQERQ